jgi:two-component system sensor histidine kinase HydH
MDLGGSIVPPAGGRSPSPALPAIGASAPAWPLSPDHSLGSRLKWITGLRLAFLALLLSATATLYLRGELARYSFSLRIVLVAIAAGFALAGVYAAILRSKRHLQILAWAQIALDQITWTAIVYVSGGATSGATSFYALTCLIGAILVGMRGAAAAAGIGFGVYALLCTGLYFGWVPSPPDQADAAYATEPAQVVYPILLNALAMTVVALLGGYLAERLRLTGGALQVATRRADEAERLAVLGRIAAALAHEIRNPLGSITGSIEMLRESQALSEEDRQLCDIVQREARRLNDLVGDMIDLSKPRPPRAEATDVAALSREVVALASNASRGSDVRVVYEGPEREALARCDGPQMRQVLWNLVRNAMQASSAGSTVTVRVEKREREVTLTVDDQGAGIPDAVDMRIFDEFFTTRTHGAGIGLAVVRRILDDHAFMGARLFVDRAAGGGASFQVSLDSDVTGLRKSSPPPRPRPS